MYAAQKQWQNAIAHYQKALKLDSQQAGIWRNLAKAFSQAGDAGKAAEAWYRAYRLEPNQHSAEAHLQLGNTLAEQQKWEEAIACYQNAVAGSPNWALAHYRLGETLKQAGRQEEATASLRRAIECHGEESTLSEDSSGQSNSQELTVNQENHSPVEQGAETDRSKKLLKQALETDDGETYIQLAQAYLEKQQCQRAIAAARQALAIQPNANAYRWLGIALQQNNQIKEAKQCYQAAISLQPDWAEPNVDLGNWHLAQKQRRQAINCYRQALKLDSNHSTAYRGLAQAFQGLGKQSKALECRYLALSQANDETTAEDCIELARSFARQKQWEKAIACYRKALHLNSQETAVWQELADILAHQGQLQEASTYYRQVLQENPNSIKSWQALGKMLTQLGEREEAEACYEQAQWLLTADREKQSSATVESNETTVASALKLQQEAEASLEQGDSELALKKYQEAFAYLTGQNIASKQIDIFLFSSDNVERLSLSNSGNQSLASLKQFTFFSTTFPTFTKGLSWLLEKIAKLKWLTSGHFPANIYWEKQKQQPIEKTIEVTPENATEQDTEVADESVQVLARRARACLEARDWARCILNCEEMLKHDPIRSEGYKLLGQARHGQGELSQALEAYRKAISLNPQELEARVWCGQILAGQEQWQDAIAYYRQALQQDPQRWEVYHLLGEALEASGDIDCAIAAYQKAIELDRNQPPFIYKQLGDLLQKQKQYEEAITAYQKAIELKPDNPAFYNVLGGACLNAGRANEAIAAYQKFAELKGDNPGAYKKLGDVLKKQGRLQEAITAYQKAIELNPQNYSLYQSLGDTLLQDNRNEEALEAYRKALGSRRQKKVLLLV